MLFDKFQIKKKTTKKHKNTQYCLLLYFVQIKGQILASFGSSDSRYFGSVDPCTGQVWSVVCVMTMAHKSLCRFLSIALHCKEIILLWLLVGKEQRFLVSTKPVVMVLLPLLLPLLSDRFIRFGCYNICHWFDRHKYKQHTFSFCIHIWYW